MGKYQRPRGMRRHNLREHSGNAKVGDNESTNHLEPRQPNANFLRHRNHTPFATCGPSYPFSNQTHISSQTSSTNRPSHHHQNYHNHHQPCMNSVHTYKDPSSHHHCTHESLTHQRYHRIIREISREGALLEQKLNRMLDGLAYLQPGPEEMEWEGENTLYFVARTALPLTSLKAGSVGSTEGGTERGSHSEVEMRSGQ